MYVTCTHLGRPPRVARHLHPRQHRAHGDNVLVKVDVLRGLVRGVADEVRPAVVLQHSRVKPSAVALPVHLPVRVQRVTRNRETRPARAPNSRPTRQPRRRSCMLLNTARVNKQGTAPMASAKRTRTVTLGRNWDRRALRRATRLTSGKEKKARSRSTAPPSTDLDAHADARRVRHQSWHKRVGVLHRLLQHRRIDLGAGHGRRRRGPASWVPWP